MNLEASMHFGFATNGEGGCLHCNSMNLELPDHTGESSGSLAKSRSAAILLILAIASSVLGASSPDYVTLRAKAEKLYHEDSFALAHQAYEQAAALQLTAFQKRWVAFRLADTLWRAQAATQTADNTLLEKARADLESLLRETTHVEDRDRVWAEAQESLADFFWARRYSGDWNSAWPHYQKALDWWAGARDIDLARRRYLGMVWKMARPPWEGATYGMFGAYIPLDILQNALKVAVSPDDKAHAHYLIAMTLRNQGSQWERQARIPAEFEAAIKLGRKNPWYDDALFNYAQWMLSQGRLVPLENGGWTQQPDYTKALQLLRRLTSQYKKGETRYWEQAQSQIKDITGPQVGVNVQHVFLPGSEIQYVLTWRNVKRIDLALIPVDLNRDVALKEKEDWLHSIDLAGMERLRSWSWKTSDQGDHKPGSQTLHLKGKLKPGAYVLEATGGTKTARDLVLVSDATLVLKASGHRALAYFCNALDGAPIPGAAVKLWERYGFWDGKRWVTRIHQTRKVADTNGIAILKLWRPADAQMGISDELFASAGMKHRQAFALATSSPPPNKNEIWRFYAFTDRPAYRPKETVHWKFIARQYDGSVYSTPADQIIHIQIYDPRNAKVLERNVTLNAFGTAWGSLDLTETMPLGEYRITFLDKDNQHNLGGATLFRLEEYKLPEFKVTVRTPEEHGKKRAFRLGERVKVTIQADYYFGGPVANANVEVLVHQRPFYHFWHQPRAYPWFYDDIDNPQSRWNRWYGGEGQIVKRETLKTDATGKATLTFDTPADSRQDLEYRIEARVTDASRREITGDGAVRVTRQRYYVYANPEHYLYRPQDKVTIDFKALDANDQPVKTDGIVKVTRDRWLEVWLAPDGREVKGEELRRLQSQAAIFPPLPQPGRPGWQLKFKGYEHDEILTRTLTTDTNGLATLTFTPERDGYYRIAWTSEDSAGNEPEPSYPMLPPPPITAQTTVWVATGATTELGYRYGGVQIITDKDTFHVGQKAPVMLVSPANDRYILFTVEGQNLYNYQLIHLGGTVKLVELPIEEKHVPNIFLRATLVSDRQIFTDSKQIVVPPVKNFITVDVKPDRAQYEPRDQGTFTITTRNDQGKPVSAEVAFGLADESVFYIQQDYAGDPRQFFFGTKRSLTVQTSSTMNQKSYAELVRDQKGELIDERDLALRMAEQSRSSVAKGFPGAERDRFVTRSGGTELEALRELGLSTGESIAVGGIGGGFAANHATAKPMFLRRYGLNGGSYYGGAAYGGYAAAPADMVQAGRPAASEPFVQVRSDFRSTAFWQPDIITDGNGQATVTVKYPDSLTTWKATARAVSKANQFGIGDASTRTKMPLIVRLEAPCFFVVGDTVTLSAVANNNTDKALDVKVSLQSTGGLDLNQHNGDDPDRNLTVPPNGEARADWTARVVSPGEVKLKATARGGQYADAMEKSYPVYEHGIEKLIAESGKTRADNTVVTLDLPSARKSSSTTLSVQITPSLAVTMLDALPYLIGYPYGCTEQTMSRFLPAAITAKTLKDLGIKPNEVMGRVFGGIEPAHAGATHPRGKKNLAELNRIIKAGLDRLWDFQHADGGWGWWKQGETDQWMTAYVVWGLALAREAGIEIRQDAFARAARYLDQHLVEEEENPDMQAWMLHALAAADGPAGAAKPSAFQTTAFNNLWAKRDQLNAYTRALFALAAHRFGYTARAKILIRNLENGVKFDNRPNSSVLVSGPSRTSQPANSVLATAHWGEDGIYWHWSEGGVEATAFALRALVAIDPQDKLVEPVTNWLIKNRRGAQWNSTRDTAIVVLALNDYLRASGELQANVEYALSVNGTPVATNRVSGEDVFNAPSRFTVDPKLIQDHNDIRITRLHGDNPLYFSVEVRFFSQEDPITPAGNELFVKRQYFKLVPRPTLLKGYVYDRVPLHDGDSVQSGQRVETVLTIDAKNNYEYLLFEDLKPAGFESVQVRSGEPLYARELKSGALHHRFDGKRRNQTGAAGRNSQSEAVASSSRLLTPAMVPIPQPSPGDEDYTGRTRWVYEELRDRKVALFLDKLPQGVWEIRYAFRAEVPGRFHALPALGRAMYVPELRCNSAELRLRVTDAPKPPR